MPFFFRLIGLAAGLRFAKPIAALFQVHANPNQVMLVGALAGFVIGFALDAGTHVQIRKFRMRRYIKRRLQYESNEVFFNSVFSMLAKLAQVDGAISSEEIATVERVMTELLKLKRKQKKIARGIFNSAKTSPSPFQLHAAQYCQTFAGQPQMLEGMLNILFQLAVADKALSIGEERLILSAAQIFGMDEAAYQAIACRYVVRQGSGARTSGSSGGTGDRGSQTGGGEQGPPAGTVLGRLQQAYALLGCKESDSPAAIKSRYRKLINDFHPDKIVSKDLPQEFTIFATQKFRQIQEAYETIKRERGIS